MTEENKDSPKKKLRLSRTPKEAGAEAEAEPKAEQEAEQEAEPKAEPKPEPKPDLRLKRPPEQPESIKSQTKSPLPPPPKTPSPEPPSPEPSAPEPATAQPEGHSVHPPEERGGDSGNSFKSAANESKSELSDPAPPRSPEKPAPADGESSAREVEEAIGQIGEEKKNRTLLTSIFVILALIAVLGGSGYGLYYILQNPAGASDTASTSEQTSEQKTPTEESDEDSGSRLSQQLAKAKTIISNIPETEIDFEEKVLPPAALEKPKPEVQETETVETAETVLKKTGDLPPSVDSSQANSVSEFLQNAHIGGVRTGDRPKLILDGKSYNKDDLVDPNNGLRFIGLRDKKLAFRDEQGIVYIKSF